MNRTGFSNDLPAAIDRVIPVQLRQYMVNTVFNFAKLFQYGKEVFLLIVVMKSQFDG